jgi:2'-5' RNA ligase
VPVDIGPREGSEPTYHLWVKPHGAAYDVLSRTIHTLARQLDAPVFEPHVTVLGELEGTEEEHVMRGERLARQLAPFRIDLTGAQYGEEYFRSLYMLVEPAPPVMNAHAAAKRIFQRNPERPYMPHLSLLYGVCPPARRAEILSWLRPGVKTSFEPESIVLIRAGSTSTKDWEEIGEFALRGSA